MRKTSIFKRCTMSGVILLSLIGYSKTTFASATLTSPTSAEAITSSNALTLSYTIVGTPDAGSITVTFTNGLTDRTIHLNDTAKTVNCTMIDPTSNIVAQCNSITAITEGTTIPDGIYSVVLSYLDSGVPVSSATATSVTVDTATLVPTLTTPATGATYTGTLPIQYSIPEAAAASTKQIVISNVDHTITLTLKDSAQTSFNLDLTADPITNSNILASSASSIPDGTYSVHVSYQDVFLNPKASSTTNTNVVIQAQAPSTPTPTATPTATSTPAATILPGAASAGTGGGGGCGYIQDIRDRENGSNGALFESLLWIMLCAFMVLSLKNKSNDHPSATQNS